MNLLSLCSHITTSVDTSEKERFCSFPHRHGNATRKPENRDETCWSLKMNISCEAPSIFHTLYSSKLTFSYMGMSQNEECGPGSLTRGYDSWV